MYCIKCSLKIVSIYLDMWDPVFIRRDNAKLFFFPSLFSVFYKMGILIAVLGIWFSSSLVEADSKAVTTSLTTKWSSTPLLLETRWVVIFFHCPIRICLMDKAKCSLSYVALWFLVTTNSNNKGMWSLVCMGRWEEYFRGDSSRFFVW